METRSNEPPRLVVPAAAQVPLFCTLNHRAHRRNGLVAAQLPGFGFCAALSHAARCTGSHSTATRRLPAQRAALLLEVLLVVEAQQRSKNTPPKQKHRATTAQNTVPFFFVRCSLTGSHPG